MPEDTELLVHIAKLEAALEAHERRIQELEADRKSALITALLLLGGGFVTLFTIIARKAGVLGIAAAFFILTLGAATAVGAERQQPFCDVAWELRLHLFNFYKERIYARGMLAKERGTMEMWRNERTGSWTLLRVKNGIACVEGAGWQFETEEGL